MPPRNNPAVVDIHRKKQQILDQIMRLDGALTEISEQISRLYDRRYRLEQERRSLIGENGDASRLVGDIARFERQKET